MRHECLKFYEFFFEIDDETSTLYSTLAATAEQQATEKHKGEDKITSVVLCTRIFVYNICLISISDTVSDQATKAQVLNIERTQHK